MHIRGITIFFISFLLCFCSILSAAEKEKESDLVILDNFLHIIKQNAPEEIPVSGIYSRDNVLFCEGNTEAAAANNRAAEMMLKGDYEEAKNDLEKSLPHAPLFLPFRYNLGVCYYHLNDRRRSRHNLVKARQIVPEYFMTDIQLGYLEQLEGKDDAAILHFREALRKNPKHLDCLVDVGNIYFNRKQMQMASKYYDLVLKIDPVFGNALLGRAKVFFVKNEFYKSYNVLEMISIKDNYDKSYHFYYAECAYKLQNYKKALEQYTILLKFKQDRFFVTTSLNLIAHKQELARRFVSQFEEK